MNKNTVLYILATCMVFANFFVYSKIITHEIPEITYENYVSQPIHNENVDEIEENAKEGYRYISASVSDTKSGPLVLVNTTHPYTFDNIPTIVEKTSNASVYAEKSQSYSVKDINVMMNTEAIKALNTMLDDFSAHLGGKKNVIVTEGHRTYEEQQEMLELKIKQYGEDQKIAQKPGYSEHHTGLAMDISTYVDGVMGTFTGTGEYAWVFENAHKYGFILRYPEDKVEETGISYESWHFRYVGVPHAEYIYRNNISFEWYIEMLSLYPVDSAQLEITDEATGKTYGVYSVSVLEDGTQLPIPKGLTALQYSLSGDNNGHVIVTYEKH